MPWLINTRLLELEYFDELPPGNYAILSHTWDSKDEITFDDIHNGKRDSVKKKAGWSKIEGCCHQALLETPPLEYAWMDSCCIDKKSSAELSEAINSMYGFYENAKVCYIYLSDVTAFSDQASGANMIGSNELHKSRWFTRGWTLQELIAPTLRHFFAREWTPLGAIGEETSGDLLQAVVKATGISSEYLNGHERARSIRNASVAVKFSWASSRMTTRKEDIAYSLMGLFAVNMPILYGEGPTRAFRRLQLTILERSGDHSIFAWQTPNAGVENVNGVLADHPKHFSWCVKKKVVTETTRIEPFSMTNIGLSIKLPIYRHTGKEALWTAVLDCYTWDDDGYKAQVGIRLRDLNLLYNIPAIARPMERDVDVKLGFVNLGPHKAGKLTQLLILDLQQRSSIIKGSDSRS